RISSVANITRNFRVSRTSRIRSSKASFKRASRSILNVRRALQAIRNRRPESLKRNSFCNDKIDIERIEFAQVAKQIRGGFAKILLFAQIPKRDEALVFFDRIPRQQCATLVRVRRE